MIVISHVEFKSPGVALFDADGEITMSSWNMDDSKDMDLDVDYAKRADCPGVMFYYDVNHCTFVPMSSIVYIQERAV